MLKTTVTITIDVPVCYTVLPGDPGRTFGPPEMCYPPSDPEIDDWYVDATPKQLMDTVLEAIEDMAFEQMLESAERGDGI